MIGVSCNKFKDSHHPPEKEHQSFAEARANNITASLKLATTLMEDLQDALGTTSLQAISQTTKSLVTVLQNAKKNKLECIQLLEDTHVVLYAIVNVHLKSDIPGSLPPSMLDHIGNFTEQVHSIDCHIGLQLAKELFNIESGTSAIMDAAAIHKTADNMHQELLEIISNMSAGASSEEASSVYSTTNSCQISSKSLTMLPSKPKIFYGRESELNHIVQMLSHGVPRVAILGAGGMGKTTLARATLHHAAVALEARTGVEELLSLLTDIPHLALMVIADLQ
ncbi:hypothetical protein MVEN_00906300 [Mycena venus]|uniref:NB-ARC domain-containing protein n=1 Tax=Mycena venus TaxID=2733690 RepID=A0A8H6YIF8_9AGAR|nr:hypothetical protein MVEN_00906300 [Mycena venus]